MQINKAMHNQRAYLLRCLSAALFSSSVATGCARSPALQNRSKAHATPHSAPVSPPSSSQAKGNAATPTSPCRAALSSQRAASLVPGRRYHAAVSLADGRVLVTGGSQPRRADVYNPTERTWRNVGDLRVGRQLHTATLLADGRVLVVGGTEIPSNSSYSVSTSAAELFDPSTGTWTAITPAPQPRRYHVVVLLAEGSALVLGGSVSPVGATALFDPRDGGWRSAAPLSQNRSFPAATLLQDGSVLVVGGQGDAPPNSGPLDALASVEVYDPSQDRWSPKADIPEPRKGATATLLQDGRVLVVGGWNRRHGRTRLVDLFDPVSGQWREAAELNLGRDEHTATLLSDGRVLVVGGQSNRVLEALTEPVAEIYDPVADRWVVQKGVEPRRGHSAVAIPGGSILLLGGYLNPYDPPLENVQLLSLSQECQR